VAEREEVTDVFFLWDNKEARRDEGFFEMGNGLGIA
jgi:hypothetical protein